MGFISFSPHQKLLGWLNRGRRDVTCMVIWEMHTEFWCGNLKEGDHLQDLDVDIRTALKLITNKLDMMAWTGFIRINIERNGGLLRRWQENSGSIKCVDCMQWMGNYLLAIQEGICSVRSVTLSHSLTRSLIQTNEIGSNSFPQQFINKWPQCHVSFSARHPRPPSPQQHVIFHHL